MGTPVYSDQYKQKIDDLLNKVTNPTPFTYDAVSDPQYAAYKTEYTNLGDRAMKDTIGQVAATSGGGTPSSWAVSAASQAKDNYNQQLTDKIPALYQAAYGMYQDQQNNNYNALGALGNADNNAYSQFSTDRGYNTGVDQFNQNMSEQKSQDATSASEWQKTFNQNNNQFNSTQAYNTGRDTVADNRYNQNQTDAKYNSYLSTLQGMANASTDNYAQNPVTKAYAKTGSTTPKYTSDQITNYVYNLPIDDATAAKLLSDLGITPPKK